MKNCYNCKNGRRAGIENMVACAYFFAEHQFDHQKTMEELRLESMSTGWGFMNRPVDDDEGTIFGRGIMTNGVPIFNKDFCCNHFCKNRS